MSTVAYEIVDVFTDRPFAGNPLAVVFGADALAGDQMQALAREFNLSETVFVSAPRDPKHRAALRIFTPARELPCGRTPAGPTCSSSAAAACAPGTSPLTSNTSTYAASNSDRLPQLPDSAPSCTDLPKFVAGLRSF